ncbi:MAG: AMP-binding enzyme [Actinomycetota bacterium]
MTETCGGVVYDGVAFPDVTVDVRADGRIVVGGPTLLRRYRGDADATAAAFDDAGRFVTSDLGRIGPDGRLEVLGRADDAITTGGETVMPLAVERVLATHPAVGEAAVVGRPDPEWGERVVAVVVPRGSPPALEDLRAHVRGTLPPWAAPRELVLVERLPRTISGKVRRVELRDLLG